MNSKRQRVYISSECADILGKVCKHSTLPLGGLLELVVGVFTEDELKELVDGRDREREYGD